MKRVTERRLWREAIVACRMLFRPRHVRTHGVRLVIDRKWPRSDINSIYLDLWEVDEVRVIRGTLRSDDRLLEIGAGVGVVTTVACQCIGDDRVTSIEANPALVSVIAETAHRNGFRPEIINAAVGDTDGPRDFYVYPEFRSSSLEPQSGATRVSVPGRGFDDELRRVKPTYLVLDIEGGEVELLDRVLPESIRAICVETHPNVVGLAATNRLVTGLVEQGLLLDTEHLSGTTLCFVRQVE